MTSRIIVLSGWKGSGKNTTADYLTEKYGYVQLSFAEKLKDLVSVQYSIPREVLDDPTRKEMPLHQFPVIHTDRSTYEIITRMGTELQSGYWTPRALCILEGQAKRSVHSNYWVQSAIREITANSTRNYVITDMRFRSEMDTLRMFFSTSMETWRVNRFDRLVSTDPSERDLDGSKFDAYLSNTGSLVELHQLIDTLMNERGD